MLKRFILASVTMLAVLLCLLIYRQSTERFSSPSEKITIPDEISQSQSDPVNTINVNISGDNIKSDQLSIGPVEAPRFVAKNKEGRKTREFGFEKRLSKQADLFEVSNPWISFYSKDGNIVEITAPLGTMPIEFVGGQLQEPSSGSLQGGVLIEVFSYADTPSASSDKPVKIIDYTINLDRIDFQREFSQLTSEGNVLIDGSQFGIKGKDLSIHYDQVNERIQELKLNSYEYIRINSSMGFTSLTGAGSDSSVSVNQETPSPAALPKQPSSADTQKNEKPTDEESPDVYALLLEKNISIERGTEKVTADGIVIYAKLDGSSSLLDDKEQSEPDSSNSNSDAESKQSSQQTASDSTGTEPEYVILKGDGPLNLFAIEADEEVFDILQKDNAFIEASGSPVKLWRKDNPADKDYQLVGEVGKIQYHDNQKTVQLWPGVWNGTQQNLWIARNNQRITTDDHITLDPTKQMAFLSGTGQILYTSPNPDESSQIDFTNTTLNIKTQNKPDSNNGDDPLKKQEMESLAFEGNQNVYTGEMGILTARLGQTQLQANSGRLTFFQSNDMTAVENNTDNKPISFDRQLKTVELVGQVTMKDPNNLFRTDFIKSVFILDDQGKSLPDEILAVGDVLFMNDEYKIEASESLQILYDPNQSQIADNSEIESETELVKEPPAILSNSFMQDTRQPNLIIAKGPNGGVLLEQAYKKEDAQPDSNAPMYSIRADHMEGVAVAGDLFKKGCWTLTGNDNMDATVSLLEQGRTLQGKQIQLDANTRQCSIPGKGSISVLSTNDLAGKKLDNPIVVNIVWKDKASYSTVDNIIEFQTVQASMTETTDEKIITNKLISPMMTVSLSDKPKDETAAESNTSDDPLMDTSKMLTEMIAHGPTARLFREEIQRSDNTLLTSLNLVSPQISYNGITERIIANGQGYAEILDYRIAPETPADQSEKETDQKSLDTMVNSSFRASGPSYTLINSVVNESNDNSPWLIYDDPDNSLWFVDNIALHRTEWKDDQFGQITNEYHLYCDNLNLKQNKTDQTDSSTPTVGSLQANGHVIFEAKQEDGLSHFFSSKSLIYNQATDWITILGDHSLPVRIKIGEQHQFNDVQMLKFRYNLSNHQFEGKPLGQSAFTR